LGVSKNSGKTPKSSILIGFSIINHPFWGIAIFGNTQKATASLSAFLLWSDLSLLRFATRENDQDLIAKIAAASEHDDDDDQVLWWNW